MKSRMAVQIQGRHFAFLHPCLLVRFDTASAGHSCINVDGCSDFNHRVDVFDLLVRHRDAPRRPIPLVRGINSRARSTVNEDISTGRPTLGCSKCDIRLVRVRDTNRKMKQAFGISPVNHIRSFGCAPVPFKFHTPDRTESPAQVSTAPQAIPAG